MPKFKAGDLVVVRDDEANRAEPDYASHIGTGPYEVERVSPAHAVEGSDLLTVYGIGGIYAYRCDLHEDSAPEVAVDEDLYRGYAEECSTYRACQNEQGQWIIEATRVRIIAQCADETEALRIEQALNDTI